MTAVVCLTNLDASNFAGAIDTALGYPLNGLDMGYGVHGPKAGGQTVRYAQVFKHPTLSLWACQSDPAVSSFVGKGTIPLPSGAVVQTLDSTWDPAIKTLNIAAGQ